MKVFLKILKWTLAALSPIALYLLLALILTAIPVNTSQSGTTKTQEIFLNSNGVHLDIVISKSQASEQLLNSLYLEENDQYLSVGWGDENFYINTPTWGDLTFKTAFTAAFVKSATLMHITRHKTVGTDWVKVKITDQELTDLNSYISNSFKLDEYGTKIKLEGHSYGSTDEFYKATGTYTALNTCNTWANSALKENGIKACLWTPFDYGIMNKHR